MQPLNASQLRGTWGTLLLPLNDDDTIDYGRLSEQLEQLIAAGLDGIYTNGTAGEFHTQSEAEFDAVSQLVAERCERTGLPFQIGVSHMSAQIALERLRRVRELRPGAIQVILPDWISPTLAEAQSFLLRMAELADPLPLVLYNPPHAKRVLDPAEIAALRAVVPSLIGIKVLDGGPSWYATMRGQLAECAVFVPGHHLATGILNGAQGSYSNVACLSPAGAKRWNNLMYHDIQAALAIEHKILSFFQGYIAPLGAQGYSNPALDKLLAAIGGWATIGTRLRWPYRGIPDELVGQLAPIARRMLPELFPDG